MAKFVPYKTSLFRGKLLEKTMEEKARRYFEGLAPEDGEEIEFAAPRIPIALYLQALGFFNWCYYKLDSEGMLSLVFKNGVWSLACPVQSVSSAQVKADFNKFRNEFIYAVGDIHSHPHSMGAFHSGVDHDDEIENRKGIHIVVSGSSDFGFSPMVSTMSVMGCVKGKRFTLRPEAVWDTSRGVPMDMSFPKDWTKRVSKGYIARAWGKVKGAFMHLPHGVESEEDLMSLKDIDFQEDRWGQEE